MKGRVKLLLDIRGIKQKDIARTLGVSPTVVNLIIHGKKRSRRVENYIAQIVGIKRDELFPDREAA